MPNNNTKNDDEWIIELRWLPMYLYDFSRNSKKIMHNSGWFSVRTSLPIASSREASFEPVASVAVRHST